MGRYSQIPMHGCKGLGDGAVLSTNSRMHWRRIDRCSLGPPKGLEEKEPIDLAANKDLLFTYDRLSFTQCHNQFLQIQSSYQVLREFYNISVIVLSFCVNHISVSNGTI
ncbi:PREDICTED: uncharacterized protein LOC104598364 [Nelumbo nucifera]|uniref:Uncharacterized protein LOC104598364 n=1 Tax=Nelumbo nucifera TaxID=4432 RepID=A0A1U8A1T1_NELNU|nr:PREDICTED: uncharacterized protein LOC104598364 [Nelumbo nucifera]